LRRQIRFADATIDRSPRRALAARDVADARRGEERLHTGFALRNDRKNGAGFLGAGDLLERGTIALEQPGNGGKRSESKSEGKNNKTNRLLANLSCNSHVMWTRI
jgi:hypothetical protein